MIFHQRERYEAAYNAISIMRGSCSRCRILEIGANRHQNLKQYFPEDQIVFSDVIYEKEELNNPEFVLADVTCMDFEDESFNFVVALDVIEHLPQEDRKIAISEMIRVAQNGVFFSFPHYRENDNVVHSLERIYQYGDVTIPIWLYEHNQMGLPSFLDIKEITLQCIDEKCLFTSHAVDSSLNTKMLKYEAYTSCYPEMSDAWEWINDYYVKHYLKYDRGGNEQQTVKSYFTICKKGFDADKLCQMKAVFDCLSKEKLSEFETMLTRKYFGVV